MLLVFHRFSDVNMLKILPVYGETIVRVARKNYRDPLESASIMHAQDQFVDDLRQFFDAPKAMFFVWTAQEQYISALRTEQYRDGLLISYLETHPAARGKGYAQSIVGAAVYHLEQSGHKKIYSHIEKRNAASIAVHRANDFEIVADCATLLDGTVSQNYYTLQHVAKESTAG